MKDMLIKTINREFIHFEEGTGDNLLKEDIEAGYVDYINWTKWIFENGEFQATDGGMLLLKKPCDEAYPDAHGAIMDVLNQAYDEIHFIPMSIY